MNKSMQLLWTRVICILLVLLACSTALAGNPATPTDLDDPDPTGHQDPDPTGHQDPDPTGHQDPDPTGHQDPPATTPPLDWVIEGDVLIACNSKAEELKVPKGIREIGPKAFKGLKKLKVVTLPDSVEKIGKEAFAGCVKLEQVKLTKKSKLKEIGSHAFKDCKKLDTGFVPKGVKVAKNAFEGAGQKPKKTPKPTPKPTPTPEPTPAPKPRMGGGGGGSSGTKIPHSRWKDTPGPDYDLLSLKELAKDTRETMNRLTLGGERLALALNQEEAGKDGDGFTAAGKIWEKKSKQIDTLVLTAAEEKDRNVWYLNGEVLRRMHKSGIFHLVLRSGTQIAVLETEGFLAGWHYDEFKSRGTANRRFEYTVEMNKELPARWQVAVEGELYELTTDEHAGIYMTGVYSGSVEALNKPYDKLFAKE